MTRLQGGSVSPPDSASDRSAYHLSKLPPGAPDIVSRNTISITDPAKVLPWHKEERQRQFNLLVKRYKNQLLYGCQEPNCTTPTCFSFRKRVTDAPLRRFTDLSARTVAVYLASQDNPERGLCRHSPVTNVDSLERAVESPPKRYRSPRQQDSELVQGDRRSSADRRVTATQNADPLGKESSGEGENIDVQDTEAGGSPVASSSVGANRNFDESAGGDQETVRLKDPKSFTQNLFDTFSLRMVEWLPLRRQSQPFDPAPSVGQSSGTGRKSPGSEPVPRRRQSSDDEKTPRQRRSSASKTTTKPNSQHTASSSTPPQPTAVEVKLPGQPVKRLSLPDPEQWKHSHRVSQEDIDKARSEKRSSRKRSTINTPSNTTRHMQSPPPLKHRPQKHRQVNTDISRSGPKRDRRVSWDSSKVSTQQTDLAGPGDRGTEDLAPVSQASPTQRRKAETEQKDTQLAEVQPVQTLSHLSGDIVRGLEGIMFGCDEDAEKWKDEMQELDSRGYSGSWNWNYATPHQQQSFPFVAQSVYYVLSSPDLLLRSFRSKDPASEDRHSTSISKINAPELKSSFQTLYRICPSEIALHSLWVSLEHLFIPPGEFSHSARQQLRHRRQPSGSASGPLTRRRADGDRHISDSDAAQISVIALSALVSSIPPTDPETWEIVRRIRAAGTVVPDSEMRQYSRWRVRRLIDVAGRFEQDLALRMVNRLARAFSARLAFHEISKSRLSTSQDPKNQDKSSFIDFVLDLLQRCQDQPAPDVEPSIDPDFSSRPTSISMITVEWLRNLILKEWDGKPELSRAGAIGGALQLLASMYHSRVKLGLLPKDFHTPFFSDRLDPIEMPVEWIGFVPNNKTVHLLSYPFLLPPSALVTYFRALNYSTMSKSYETAMTSSRHMTQTAFSSTIPVHDDVRLLARLKTAIATFLVIQVRRENVLMDAFDQLWRREKRELMRPLKVKMGMQEGEEGVDHGGVQQEFFRLAIGEALDPAYGLFSMDMRSRISWFQPGSFEPLYKYELLGLLFSLAVYNGLTLPINFPIALYRKLLGLKVKSLDHIKEGWEELARGLQELLSWSDGDVGDIFMRTYEFSFDSFGTVTTVDMEKVGRNDPWPAPERSIAWDRRGWPSNVPGRFSASEAGPSTRPDTHESVRPGILKGSSSRSTRASVPAAPPEEAAMVTNENRERFVKDYIFWLTDKSIRPQYEAFARGFYTCLDRTALSIFTPEALKTVIEGIQEIDVRELEKVTRYEYFDPGERTITYFWDIVRNYPQAKLAQLLEFVTASDRVPVNGLSSILFVLQKNGDDESRLPTSLTCFGRLLMPEYSSRAILEEKLDKALENARGFGVA